MIYPAIHYTMGGIWVDYELQTSIKGLFAIGECNFSDHGANRLGASALMQGLADGYFVLPYTIQNYLADQITVPRFSTELPEFAEAEKAVQARIDHLMGIKGKKSVDSIHKELGHIMWEYVGMGRTEEGLKTALKLLKDIRKEFETNLFIAAVISAKNTRRKKAKPSVTTRTTSTYLAGSTKALTTWLPYCTRNLSFTKPSRFRHVTTRANKRFVQRL